MGTNTNLLKIMSNARNIFISVYYPTLNWKWNWFVEVQIIQVEFYLIPVAWLCFSRSLLGACCVAPACHANSPFVYINIMNIWNLLHLSIHIYHLVFSSDLLLLSSSSVPRMHIKKIILDGFKSYAQRTEIAGWDKHFNAITGLNGSGKSNVLDAICFVLGISSSHLQYVSYLLHPTS